jgi:hypothetical protein
MGEDVATTTFSEMQEFDKEALGRLARQGRKEHLDLIDSFLDPMGPANLRWAMSPLADDADTYKSFSLGFGSMLLTQLESESQ